MIIQKNLSTYDSCQPSNIWDVMHNMDNDIELQERLNRIEEICESYLETPGFPKNVVIKHVIDIAKGEKPKK